MCRTAARPDSRVPLLSPTPGSERSAIRFVRARLTRAVTIDGVGNKNACAHNSQQRGECFQHGGYPKAQRVGPNGTRPYTVKRIPGTTGLLRPR